MEQEAHEKKDGEQQKSSFALPRFHFNRNLSFNCVLFSLYQIKSHKHSKILSWWKSREGWRATKEEREKRMNIQMTSKRRKRRMTLSFLSLSLSFRLSSEGCKSVFITQVNCTLCHFRTTPLIFSSPILVFTSFVTLSMILLHYSLSFSLFSLLPHTLRSFHLNRIRERNWNDREMMRIRGPVFLMEK